MKFTRRTAIIAGSASAVAVAGVLIAGPAFARGGHNDGNQFSLSTGSSDSATATPGQRGPGMMGDGDHGMRGQGGPGMMVGRTIHSTGVAAQTDSAGKTTYVNVASQSGTVVSATDSRITVKSADGVQWSWTIDASTVLYRNGATAKGSAFQAGDTVEVSGKGTGDGATAGFVMSGGMMGGHGFDNDGDGPRGMMGDGGSGAGTGTLAPVPSTSASSTNA